MGEMVGRRGRRAGLLISSCPRSEVYLAVQCISQGCDARNVIVPTISRGLGAVDTNDWCITPSTH